MLARLAVGDAEMSAAIRKAQRSQERLLRDELRQQGTTYAPESIEIRLLSHTLDALVDALIDPVAPLDRADVSQVWEGHHARLLSGGKAA